MGTGRALGGPVRRAHPLARARRDGSLTCRRPRRRGSGGPGARLAAWDAPGDGRGHRARLSGLPPTARGSAGERDPRQAGPALRPCHLPDRRGRRRGHFQEALEIGRRTGERSVEALSLGYLALFDCNDGQLALARQRVDEAMALATSGSVDQFTTGAVYCLTIWICRNVGDLRRAREWTDATQRWCEEESVARIPASAGSTVPSWFASPGTSRAPSTTPRRPAASWSGSPTCNDWGYQELGEARLRRGDLDGRPFTRPSSGGRTHNRDWPERCSPGAMLKEPAARWSRSLPANVDGAERTTHSCCRYWSRRRWPPGTWRRPGPPSKRSRPWWSRSAAACTLRQRPTHGESSRSEGRLAVQLVQNSLEALVRIGGAGGGTDSRPARGCRSGGR